jgi:hypothetical protein
MVTHKKVGLFKKEIKAIGLLSSTDLGFWEVKKGKSEDISLNTQRGPEDIPLNTQRGPEVSETTGVQNPLLRVWNQL